MTYDNKARTKETGDAKHWRRDQKGGERERGTGDKKPYAKPKEGVGGLGVSRKRVARIQERRTKLGVVWQLEANEMGGEGKESRGRGGTSIT